MVRAPSSEDDHGGVADLSNQGPGAAEHSSGPPGRGGRSAPPTIVLEAELRAATRRLDELTE